MSIDPTLSTFNWNSRGESFVHENQLQPYPDQPYSDRMTAGQLGMFESTPEREETLFSCRHSDQDVSKLLEADHLTLLSRLMERWGLNHDSEVQTQIFALSCQDRKGENIKGIVKYLP